MKDSKGQKCFLCARIVTPSAVECSSSESRSHHHRPSNDRLETKSNESTLHSAIVYEDIQQNGIVQSTGNNANSDKKRKSKKRRNKRKSENVRINKSQDGSSIFDQIPEGSKDASEEDSQKLKRNVSSTPDRIPEGSKNAAEGDSRKLERNACQKDSQKLKRNVSSTSDRIPEGSKIAAEGDSQKLERNAFQKDSQKLKRNESSTSDQIPEGSNNAAEGDPQKLNRDGPRTTVICGDSMVKNVKSWDLKRRSENIENISVKVFNGATVKDMISYCQPSVERKPDKIILHAGTNDLSNKKLSEVKIAESIVQLAKSIEEKGVKVVVSGLIARGDYLETKRKRVNLILADMCRDERFRFVDHPNIEPLQHLNRSKLHLNREGDNILAENFLEVCKSDC